MRSGATRSERRREEARQAGRGGESREKGIMKTQDGREGWMSKEKAL